MRYEEFMRNPGPEYLQDLGKPRSKKTMPESLVVNACIRWLWLQGCFVWRNNTGAWKPAGSSRPIRYGFIGSADIIRVTPSGRFISIECKSPQGGKPTEAQNHFGNRVQENNGIYIVARSIDDLEAHKGVILA